MTTAWGCKCALAACLAPAAHDAGSVRGPGFPCQQVQRFRQVTRAHRVFDPDQIEFLANIVRLWRGETVETDAGSGPRMTDAFGTGGYRDVPGLCRVASRAEIAARDRSFNPGRYVGVAPGQTVDDEEFRIRFSLAGRTGGVER